jgi:hypothetical protein
MAEQTNRISATLSDADRDLIIDGIKTIKNKLPFMIDLSPEERRTFAKMGDKSRTFVEKAAQAGAQNASLLPAAFDMAEYEKDAALYQQLSEIDPMLTQLHEKFNDTLLALGSDLYTEGLAVYTYLKVAGKGEALDELRAELGQRFKHAAKPKVPKTP